MPDRPSVHDALQTLLNGRPTREAVAVVVRHLCRFATALIACRRRDRRLHYAARNLSNTDLALDCIADCFAQAPDGHYPKLATYFEGLNWQAMDEEALLTTLRRLAFRKVDDGLYRMMQEQDPSLSRLIRNLRLAVQARDDVVLIRLDGRPWVCFAEASLPALPSVMPTEVFERRLTVAPAHTAPELLDAALTVLRDQTLHVRAFPLVGMALVLRTRLARAHVATLAATESLPTPEANLNAQDWRRTVQQAIALVAHQVRPRYVTTAEEATTFEGYETAIEAVFCDQLRHAEAVGAALGPLEEQAYRTRHRTRFEYLVRRVRDELVLHHHHLLSAPDAR